MQVSKWLDVAALLDVEEMESLRHSLPPFKIYFNGIVVDSGMVQIEWSEFLNVYSGYIEALKKGELPLESHCRPFFSSVWTVSDDSILLTPCPEGKAIPRPWQPVIQLQLHKFAISDVDGKVRSMVYGKDTIFWGIQWSFPQLFMEPETKRIIKLNQEDVNGNFAFFKQLQKWMRHNTEPTVFQIGDQKISSPIRIGLGCKEWISHHPQKNWG